MNKPRVTNPVLTAVGVIAILLGLLWIGQGANIIPGSVMSGEAKWLVIGMILAAVGGLLIFLSLNRAGAKRDRTPR